MRRDGYIDPNNLTSEPDAEGEFLHDLALEDAARDADQQTPPRAAQRARPWSESADAFDRFVADHGHLPSRGTVSGSAEHRLALWIMNQRLVDNLSPEQKDRIAQWDALPKRPVIQAGS